MKFRKQFVEVMSGWGLVLNFWPNQRLALPLEMVFKKRVEQESVTSDTHEDILHNSTWIFFLATKLESQFETVLIEKSK